MRDENAQHHVRVYCLATTAHDICKNRALSIDITAIYFLQVNVTYQIVNNTNMCDCFTFDQDDDGYYLDTS